MLGIGQVTLEIWLVRRLKGFFCSFFMSKDMRKWIVRVLLTLLVSPFVIFAIWYGLTYQPYKNQIEELAKYGISEAQPVMPELHKYAIAAETEYGIRVWASRQAYWYLGLDDKHTSTLSRHINSALWYAATYITFDDKEIFGVWVACSVSGCGKGLSGASKEYFGKEMALLNPHELLGLVAMVKSPRAFNPGSERSEKRIEYILQNLRTHNTSLQPTSALTSPLFHLRPSGLVSRRWRRSTVPC